MMMAARIISGRQWWQQHYLAEAEAAVVLVNKFYLALPNLDITAADTYKISLPSSADQFNFSLHLHLFNSRHHHKMCSPVPKSRRDDSRSSVASFSKVTSTSASEAPQLQWPAAAPFQLYLLLHPQLNSFTFTSLQLILSPHLYQNVPVQHLHALQQPQAELHGQHHRQLPPLRVDAGAALWVGFGKRTCWTSFSSSSSSSSSFISSNNGRRASECTGGGGDLQPIWVFVFVFLRRKKKEER